MMFIQSLKKKEGKKTHQHFQKTIQPSTGDISLSHQKDKKEQHNFLWILATKFSTFQKSYLDLSENIKWGSA